MFFKILVAVCLCIAIATAAASRNFFRRDYTYNEKYNAFYKLHSGETETFSQDYFLTCANEGAQFFYPIDDEEWRVIANITDKTGYNVIYVGMRDPFIYGNYIPTVGRLNQGLHEESSSVQQSFQCLLMSVITGAYTKTKCEEDVPYICKKLNNEYCPTADSDYIYSKSLKKCFKFNENAKTLADAMHTCIMEGGVLSDSLIPTDIRKLYVPSQDNICYYIDFRKISGNHFYSSRGKSPDLEHTEITARPHAIQGKRSRYNRGQSYSCRVGAPGFCPPNNYHLSSQSSLPS